MSHYFTPQPALEQTGKVQSFSWEDASIQFVTGQGVFAKSGLDAGSRLLLRTALPLLAGVEVDAKLGDLGCGWGAVGCVLATALPQAQVLMSDVNPRAVALARYNTRLNGLGNTASWCGDGLDAVAGENFRAILCNPPIRAGNAVMGRLFAGAHHCLEAGGDLYLVIRTAQGAKSWQKRLKVLFGNCQELSLKSGYRVLCCTKQ